MSSEVGSAHVSIFPEMRGFKGEVAKETKSAGAAGAKTFEGGFKGTGEKTGRALGGGLKSALNSAAGDLGAATLRRFQSEVASASAALSRTRLREADDAGKVRLAERQLAEARARYSDDSSQVVRAEERLASATRALATAQDNTKSATDTLRQAQGRLASAADSAGDQLGEAGRRSATRFSTGFREVLAGSFLGTAFANLSQNVLSAVGQAIGTGIRQAVDYGFGSVNFASDLSETRSAVQQVFGDAAPGIQKWASQGAAALGQTQQQALTAAQTFGVFGQSAGLAGDDLVGFSTSLGDLATDFSSFYNTSPEQAIEAIGAGLRGESEPLRQYGVLLDDATLKARALALGIYDGTDALTPQQRVLASYAEILAQSSVAQGDFARTSGGLANQQRILEANLADVQTQLGTALLPAITSLVTFANEQLIPVFTDIISQVGPGLGDALTESTPQLIELANQFLNALPTLIQFGESALPLIISAVQVMLPLFQFLTDQTTGWNNALTLVFGLLTGDVSLEQFHQGMLVAGGAASLLASLVGAMAGGIQAAANVVASAATTIVTSISGGVNTAVGFLQSLPQRAVSAVGDLGGVLYNSGRSLLNGFVQGIWSMIDDAGRAVSGVLDYVAGFFPHSPAKRGPFSGGGWALVKSGGRALLAQFQSGVDDGGIDLTGALSRLAQSASARAQQSVGLVSATVATAAADNRAAGSAASGATGSADGRDGATGDSYTFNGITTPTAARELFAEGNKQKRRRVGRGDVLGIAGVR